MSTLSIKSRRSFRAALSVLFLDNLGLSIVYPIFTPLILKASYQFLPPHFSLSTRMVLLGLLMAAFPFTQFIGGPIFGHLSDCKGRRYAFIVALLGEAVGFLLTGFAIQMRSYTFLIFSRLFTGFFAGNLTICLSSIADLSPDLKRRSKNFGILASVAGMSFVVAIIIGGIFSDDVLNQFLNSSLPFWIISLLSLVNVLIIKKSFVETHRDIKKTHSWRDFRFVLKIKSLRILYLIFFFFILGWVLSLQFLPSLIIEHFSGTKKMITTVLASVGVTWCVGNLWINRVLISLFSARRILFYSLMLISLCLFSLSIVRPFYLVFHLILLSALFASLAWTNALALISVKTPADIQGKTLGINQSVATLSMTFAPLFGGLLGAYDIHVIYLFAGCASLLSFLIIFSLINKIK